jgi:hypothetical protein
MEDLAVSSVVQSVRAEYYRILIIESAGLFWIFAELWIIFAVRAGRRILGQDGGSRFAAPTLQLQLRLRQALPWVVLFLVFSAVLMGRHFMKVPLDHQLEQMASSGGNRDLQEAVRGYASAERTHYAIWALFVTIWVVLEACIVYNGWQGYRRLRALLAAPDRRPISASTNMLIFVAGALVGLLVPLRFAYGEEISRPFGKPDGALLCDNTVFGHARTSPPLKGGRGDVWLLPEAAAVQKETSPLPPFKGGLSGTKPSDLPIDVRAPRTFSAMITEAHASNAVYRNALYLYLRLAGVIWIAVEWLAAYVLWKSFRLISAAVRRAEAQA